MPGRSTLARRIVLASAVSLTGACGGDQSFNPPARDPVPNEAHVASLGGYVRDQGTLQPIAGVLVEAAGISTLSKADGSYELRAIGQLVVMLVVTKEGYETTRTQLPLAAGHNDRTIILRALVSTNSPP